MSADRHMEAARELIGELQDGVCGCDMCAGIIRDALAAAEREGMKRERERCLQELRDELVDVFEDSPDIDVECNNLIRRVEGCVLKNGEA